MPILGSFGAGSGKGYGMTAGGNPYMVANGGTVTEDGVYKVHVFTSPGTFTVEKAPDPALATADYLVIAGRGGPAPSCRGGAAGGYRESNPGAGDWTGSPLANPGGSLSLSVQGYPINVGSNAAPQPSQNTQGYQGGPSTFSTITSSGGGGCGVGHYTQPVKSNPGLPGGCGGSGGGYPENPGAGGGSGNKGGYSPPEGQPGAWNGGGGVQVSAGGGCQGTGTEFTANVTDVGVPGPTGGLKYFAGGSGQGCPAPVNGGGPTVPQGGTEQAYGAAGGPSGVVCIRYRYK